MPLRTALQDTRLIAALLTTAEQEARALGDAEPGAEHLLLAALLVNDPSAREALATLGAVDAAAVRSAIVAVHSDSLADLGVAAPQLDPALPPASGAYRSEVSAQEVFQRARILSRRSRSGLRSAHVLRAAAERERGTVARLLASLALERDAVLAAAAAAVPD